MRPHTSRRSRRIRGAVAVTLSVALVALGTGRSPASPAVPTTVSAHVVAVTQVTAQDVAPRPGSEPDTVVEPDVAVSPLDPLVAVAASHDGRYPDGGAVGISYAWTHDGGRSWHHQPLPYLTSSTGGPALWFRASDPVLAFGPDGDVYLSTLVFARTCPSAVAVSRSTDAGRTFGRPVLAHYSGTCAYSDDKNTLVVDNGATSPHRGRIYQFWTPFLTGPKGHPEGSPQKEVYSDDHGRTWTPPISVSAPHANSQNSTPMIRPDGTVVDAFIDYGTQTQQDEDTGFRRHGAQSHAAQSHAAQSHAAQSQIQNAAALPGALIRTSISIDGGRSFHPGGMVTHDLGSGPDGIRCCLSSATADASTGTLLVAWNSVDQRKVKVASSVDGRHWSAPTVVNRPTATRWGVNADVAAYGGTVVVSFGLTNAHPAGHRFADQYLAVSGDGGASFGVPIHVGPRSEYAYAARAGGIFPGDYIGTAIARTGRAYAVWCVSGAPTRPGARYHQVVYGAVITT